LRAELDKVFTKPLDDPVDPLAGRTSSFGYGCPGRGLKDPIKNQRIFGSGVNPKSRNGAGGTQIRIR